MYAQIAINAPVNTAFDYHIPPELDGLIQPGHLVQIPFRTAMEYGVVLYLHDQTPDFTTKPIIERLDPRPLLTDEQIDLAFWLSDEYLAPIGWCVWLLLPPGITGGRDQLFRLNQAVEFEPADDLEAEIIALLERRGDLRGAQVTTALPGKKWRAAMPALVKTGAVEKMSVLKPPSVKPQSIEVAALAIHPSEIEAAVQQVARRSRPAEILEALARGETIEQKSANKKVIEKLVQAGFARLEADATVTLLLSPNDVPQHAREFRNLTRPLHILKLLAREGDAVDVSWVYAQTGAKLNDLKKLAEAGLVLLADKPTWRDSLAGREFLPGTPPALTVAQRGAWERIRGAINVQFSPPSTPPPGPLPVNGEGESSPWQSSPYLWRKLRELAREKRHEPTPAEDRLWQVVRRKQLGLNFRRQHTIDRFIVDFYCKEAHLIIEVDGEIHQYTAEEDALRQEFLESLGYRVIRFSNDDVLQNLAAVVQQIRSALTPPRADSPLSVYGEGPGEGSSEPVQSTLTPPPADSPLSVYGEGPGVGSAHTFLLHGVTGSGKTEIYLRAIELTLAQERSAIFLVPEIALTAQTIRRVAARFPGRVAVVHSGLSDGERYDTWRRARDGLIQVVVGARSALFTPLPDVGLIILDEEHDHSYKNSPPSQPPHYHARHVAEEMMARNNGVVIIGSATPDLESMYRARAGDIELLELPRRIMGHRTRIEEQAKRENITSRYQPDSDEAVMIDLPPVQVVDMRRELKAGNTSIFSRRLQVTLGEVLKRREQIILFMNRRGQSTYVFCRDCGHVETCPNCDTPLTYHRLGEALRCHHCGHENVQPQKCPDCGSARIKYFGAGTQQIEERLHVLFPQARTLRWDADTASTPDSHEKILERFINRKADILIGTQMVAKGLDLPLVTLVGVVSADMGLALPDFRANERIFQLLTQVAGRAGRGLLGGEVILQTYQPDHYAIATASKHDYAAFYEREIAYRRDLGYPPFRRLVRILFTDTSPEKAEREAKKAADVLRGAIKQHNLTGTELIGPAPCFFTKLNRQFRWHLLLRGPDPTVALDEIILPERWYVDIDPVDVL